MVSGEEGLPRAPFFHRWQQSARVRFAVRSLPQRGLRGCGPAHTSGAGVYTYTKPKRDDIADAWYLTAIDFDDGKTRWRALGGTGFGFNNNFAPVSIGPDGAAYVGVLGGLVRLADAG